MSLEESDGSTRKDADVALASFRDNQLRVTLRLEMLELLTKCCAKPHQIIAVGFIKLLEWKPQEMVKEQGNQKLGDLAKKFVDDYLMTFGGLVERETLHRYCSSLFGKMEKRTIEVYNEAEYIQRLKEFLSIKVGDLALWIFFTKKPEASLYDWCDKVKNRARKTLENGYIYKKAS